LVFRYSYLFDFCSGWSVTVFGETSSQRGAVCFDESEGELGQDVVRQFHLVLFDLPAPSNYDGSVAVDLSFPPRFVFLRAMGVVCGCWRKCGELLAIGRSCREFAENDQCSIETSFTTEGKAPEFSEVCFISNDPATSELKLFEN
jgi:hypothetical protein